MPSPAQLLVDRRYSKWRDYWAYRCTAIEKSCCEIFSKGHRRTFGFANQALRQAKFQITSERLSISRRPGCDDGCSKVHVARNRNRSTVKLDNTFDDREP